MNCLKDLIKIHSRCALKISFKQLCNKFNTPLKPPITNSQCGTSNYNCTLQHPVNIHATPFAFFKTKSSTLKTRRTSLSSYDYVFKIKINWKLIDMSPRLTLSLSRSNCFPRYLCFFFIMKEIKAERIKCKTITSS